MVACRLRDAKIRQSHDAVAVEHDVVRLDVAMDHVVLQRRLQRMADLADDSK